MASWSEQQMYAEEVDPDINDPDEVLKTLTKNQIEWNLDSGWSYSEWEEESDPIVNFLHYWRVFENLEDPIEKLEMIYSYALKSKFCSIIDEDEEKDFFITEIYPTLLKTRIKKKGFGNTFYDTKVVMDKVFQQWRAIARKGDCRIWKRNLKKAPELQIEVAKCHDKYLPLNQIPIRVEEWNKAKNLTWKERLDQGPTNLNWKSDNVIFLLCGEKNCITCGVKVDPKKILSRENCRVFTLIEADLMWTCEHEPKCRTFSQLFIKTNKYNPI